MTLHGGVLRPSTPGDGAIVDLTEGVRSIVRRSEVQTGVAVVFAVGSTVAVTTMEHEPGGIADLQALLDRLIPRGGEYEHNVRNHDTNARTCARRSSGRRSPCPSCAASSGSGRGSRSS